MGPPSAPLGPVPAQSPPLLFRFREAAHNRGDSAPTIESLAGWARRFILFHDKRHPVELGLAEVTRFLEHVVRTEADPLPALAQARSALALLYRDVLAIDLGELPQPRPPRVLDQVRQVLRLRHYSPRTEESYVNWARRFFRFHQLRHPRTMGTAEVEQFLTHLAVEGNISASSQNQALNALVFLYAHVLEMPLERIDAVRARRGKRLPVVLTPEEVAAVLNRVSGVPSPLDLLGSVSDEIDTTADVSRPSSLIPAASSG